MCTHVHCARGGLQWRLSSLITWDRAAAACAPMWVLHMPGSCCRALICACPSDLPGLLARAKVEGGVVLADKDVSEDHDIPLASVDHPGEAVIGAPLDRVLICGESVGPHCAVRALDVKDDVGLAPEVAAVACDAEDAEVLDVHRREHNQGCPGVHHGLGWGGFRSRVLVHRRRSHLELLEQYGPVGWVRRPWGMPGEALARKHQVLVNISEENLTRTVVGVGVLDAKPRLGELPLIAEVEEEWRRAADHPSRRETHHTVEDSLDERATAEDVGEHPFLLQDREVGRGPSSSPFDERSHRDGIGRQDPTGVADAVVHRDLLVVCFKGARRVLIELVLAIDAPDVVTGLAWHPEGAGPGIEAYGEELGWGSNVDVAIVLDLVAVLEHRIDGAIATEPTVEALNAFPQLLEFLLAAILPPDRDPNSATIGQLLWSRTAAAAIGSTLGRCVNDDHDRDD